MALSTFENTSGLWEWQHRGLNLTAGYPKRSHYLCLQIKGKVPFNSMISTSDSVTAEVKHIIR